MYKKSYNSELSGKLALRRHLLDQFAAGESLSVLDACQGKGAIWTRLRAEYPCEYMGADLNPAAGGLRVDSVRLLQLPGWRWNCVDVDTFGSPWAHWEAICQNAAGAVTVFLTWRIFRMGLCRVPRYVQRALGAPAGTPSGLLAAMAMEEWALQQLLTFCLRPGWHIPHAALARHSEMLYLGIRLEGPPRAGPGKNPASETAEQGG